CPHTASVWCQVYTSNHTKYEMCAATVGIRVQSDTQLGGYYQLYLRMVQCYQQKSVWPYYLYPPYSISYLPSTEAVTPEQEVVLRYVQPTSQVTMLMNYFNISRNTVYRILKKEPRLKACDVYTLARNMTTFMENCLCPEEVKEFISLLYRCPLTMEHNIAILKELGLHNLTAYYYIQFNKLFKCKVSLMKSWRLLPEKYDPRESVLAAMGVPQELLLTVNLPQDINECTLSEVHRELSIVFLRWCLKCDQDNIGKLRRTYNLTKSMKLQQQVVHQLHHQWDIGTSKIIQNGFLLTCSPLNMALIEKEMRLIAGTDIKDLVSLTPRILTVPYHQLTQIDSILNKIGVTPESLKAVPRICTLHPDTLQQRFSLLQQIPEFAALRPHPRMLRLLCYYNKVTYRLDLLQQVKNTNVVPSLNTLSGSKSRFHKYITVGDLRENKRDVIICLGELLNEKSSVIRKCLHIQCWGQHTTVVSVRKNLSALLKEGFSKKQILSALDVVLYPPELLLDQLTQLPCRPQAQPFLNIKTDLNVLQLLLYFMEKNASCSLPRC
ncbi:Transcription termination factor 5-like, partial [Homarus americanus]